MEEDKTHKKIEAKPELSGIIFGRPLLRRSTELINSLISLSQSIRVFAVKWQSIRSKLEELLSSLYAAGTSDSGENPSLSGAIPAILDTITECHDLARRCVDLSYSGKLLMQSDLDIICAKFDTHINNLSQICSEKLQRDSYAMVVSRPGFGASREEIKFYVNDLVSRMKIGGRELKKQALIAFNEVIHEDERYVKIAVEIESLIGFLVKFIDSREIAIQEEAVKAISVISGFDSGKSVLVCAGVIAPLIRVLESGSEVGKQVSTRCLMKLTENSDNAWSVSAHGGVTALLKMCTNCDCGGELVCGVLKNLVGVEEIRRFMVEEGAISVFVRLLRSKDEVSQINSIEFSSDNGLCGISEEAKKAMGDAGFMPELVKLLGAKIVKILALLLQFLDPEEANSGTRKFLLSILMSLTRCNSARKKIIHSGYLENIEKLAKAEVSDAKKLVRKLSSNRFRNMLSGIWHF
ncbi:ARM repeat superfamily protein [Actinidia rufa]|uniref:ARM repeat superfamily protein n=1 Tax=Actinidia rufa TaxID=165716 RepID=A0A7J0FWT9_9ERIC|nr:ARM repeat superfamily protein [Actinidia rufa]